MIRRAVLAVLFACAALPASVRSAPAPAEPKADYVWRSVKVGGGGFMPNIVFSPVEKGLVYLRSDMGGAYRFDAGAARWIPLQDDQAEGSYQGIESLAPDPKDPDVVYLAAGMYRRDPSAILRSGDRGRTWEIHPVSFRMGGNEDGRGVGERLAVDPNDTSVLLFGSRHDGLQRSQDRGRTWSLVESFPRKGLGLPAANERRTHTGLSFVVFDPSSGGAGMGSQTIFVGSADTGGDHLFVSHDGGRSWRAVTGGPGGDLLPVKAEIDRRGVLYIAYSNGAGPNGVTDGAVWRLDARTGAWSDITPDRGPAKAPGGYMGLSLDRQHPGVLAVATLNHWRPGDTVWRTTDDGRTWANIDDSRRDVAATPWLRWGEREASRGWWMAALAIDPFDSGHAAYATGATVYDTREFTAVGRRVTTWRPWVEGVEQTAVLNLTSPPAGPQLFSGFGDIGGFAHTDLGASPATMYLDPIFDNTDSVDFAGVRPQVVVRSGIPHEGVGDSLALSVDSGRTWTPLRPPLPRPGPRRAHAVAVTADGAAILATGPQATVWTGDRGRTWSPVAGLPAGVRPVADRLDGRRLTALDLGTGRRFASADAGRSFAALPTAGLPDVSADLTANPEAAPPLQATPGLSGDLWFVSRAGLFHSADAGATFARVDGGLQVEMLAFGKAPAGRPYPALFAIGRRGELRAVWRSDDAGRSWTRVNDPAHEWGRRFRCIAGDPRVFGRVYIGTDGRGILYGEPRRR